MVVAASAWSHLTPAAKLRAGGLLKRNPFYAGWVADIPEAERDQLAFVIAATWPDVIKKWKTPCTKVVTPNTGDPASYTYCNDGEAPTHAGADGNTGYTDRLEHKYWHYIDLPFSPDHSKLTEPEAPNAQTVSKMRERALGENGKAAAPKGGWGAAVPIGGIGALTKRSVA